MYRHSYYIMKYRHGYCITTWGVGTSENVHQTGWFKWVYVYLFHSLTFFHYVLTALRQSSSEDLFIINYFDKPRQKVNKS